MLIPKKKGNHFSSSSRIEIERLLALKMLISKKGLYLHVGLELEIITFGNAEFQNKGKKSLSSFRIENIDLVYNQFVFIICDCATARNL